MIQRDVGFDSTVAELSFECEQEGIYFICESPIPIEEMDITKSFDVTLKTSHQLEAAETVDIAGIPAQEINKIKLDRTKILEFEIPLISYGSMEIKVGDKTKTINYSSYLAPDTTDSEKEAGDRLGLIKTETGWTQDYKIFSDHALYNNNEIIFSADVDAPQNIDVSLEFPADSTVQLGTFYRWDNGIWIESDYILYADSLTYFKQEFDWFERNKPQVKFNISVIGDNGYVGLMDPLISACGALSTLDAVYTLTSSVSSAGTCFTVTNDNITLDCDGYNITYAQTLEGYAFYNTGGYDSVKIKNCNIDQPGTGPANSHAIYYWTGNNGEILNNNIDVRQSNCDGIYIRSSDSNLISENNIITRWGDGINIFSSLWTDIENNVINTLDADTIYLLSSARSNIINNNIISIGFGNAIYLGSSNINTIINNNVTVTGVLNRAIYVESSTSNIIYNNLFNSSTPFTFGGSILINNWNTTKQAGTRIYSDGTQIGGNYWTNPTKTGYSDTCIDSDVDDFCDVGYDLSGDGKNIDYLPLTATDVQYISACAVLDQEGTTYIMTSDIINSGANVCINISANDVTLDCQGYMIDGNVLTGDVGIGVLRTSSTDTDVTIRNCVVEDWLDYGIYLRYANQTIIRNTTVKSNWRGIYLMDQSSRNDLINITASSNSVAFYIGSDTSYNNLVNITADSNSWGVFFDESTFNNITNSVFDSSLQYGVRFYDSRNNMMTDSRISNTGTSGIYLDSDASDNKLYNNLFNNTNNVEFSGIVYTNYWNTTKQAGTRIYSDGTQIGGNYWTNPTKTGYSDTCLDSDEDDFCDVGYDLSGDGKNIDYLSLIEENNIIPPQISFIPPTELNNSHIITSYTTINVSVSDSGSPNNITAFIDWNRSLVGWWRFNQEVGESTTFFRDWSTYGNDGICLIGDCPIYTTGKFGSALSFDGADDYVEVAHSESLNLTSEITIEAWVNPDAPGQTGWSRIVSKRTTAGGADVYALGLTEDTYRPFFRITNSSIQTILAATGLAPKNQWTHLVATYNGSKMKIYINGVENASKDKIGAIKTSTIDLHLGDRKDEATGRRLNGTIDEVRIYNRSLSAEEIKASYNTGLYRLETNYTDLANGTYTYTAYAQDLLGNVNSTETRTLIIGAGALNITIESPENKTYDTQPIWFNASLNSAGGSCGYDLRNSLSFPLWIYKKNIVVSNILNTENLVDYQVLISLTSSNFDFSKANSDGSDIRFMWLNDISGAEESASFWIESWDSVGEKAFIWVKVPFIASGSITDIYMYYGNPSATTESNFSSISEYFWFNQTSYSATPSIQTPYSFIVESDRSSWGGGQWSTGYNGILFNYTNAQDIFVMNFTTKFTLFNNPGTFLDRSVYFLDVYTEENNMIFSMFRYGNTMYIYDGVQPWTYLTIRNTAYSKNIGAMNTGTEYDIGVIFDGTTWSVYVDGLLKRTITQSTFKNSPAGWLRITGRPTTNSFGASDTENQITIQSDSFYQNQYVSAEPKAIVGAYEDTRPSWAVPWSYRREIIVNNTANSENLTDYQILVDLTSSNFDFYKANLDGNDTRFTWINGISGAEENAFYWVESWDSVGEKALIWVNMPYVAPMSNGYLYMYYGNAGVSSESNGTATFDFFDDFSGSTFTSYQNRITGGCTGTCTTVDNMASMNPQSTSYYTAPYGSFIDTGGSGFCGDAGLMKEITLPFTTANLSITFAIRGWGSNWASNRGFVIERDTYGYGPKVCDSGQTYLWLACARRSADSCGSPTHPETGLPYTPPAITGGWQEFTRDISPFSGKTFRLRILTHDYSCGWCNMGDHPQDLWVDDIRIQKYLLTEPDVIVGEEKYVYKLMANDTSTHFYDSETLDEGQYSVIFRCTDSVGNVDMSDVIVFSYIFDSFVITIESPLNDTYDSKPWFNVSLSSQGLWCGYSLNGGPMMGMVNDSNTHFYIQSPVLGDGQYSIFFSCTDIFATMDISSTEYFTVDTTGPSITIQSPSNLTYTTNPWFNVTLDEPGLSCSYSLDGALYVGMSNDSDIHFYRLDASITDGPHSIRFRCTDLASNTNTTDLVYFTVDTTGSQIIVNSPLNPIYTTQIVLFNVTATDSSGVDWCGYSLNGSANVTMTAGPSDTYYFLNDTLYKGSYEVVFYCNDSNGVMNNTDPILFDVQYECMFDSECMVDNVCILNVCTPLICTDYCTNSTDLVCNSACDGKNGCNFYDAAAIAACDGQPYNQWVDYGGGNVIKCCEGTPKTSYGPDVTYAGLNPLTLELGYVADVAVSVRNRNDFEDTFTITLESTSNLRYWSWFSTHRNDEMRNMMEISFAPFEQKFISLRVLGGTVGCFNGIDNLKVNATTSFGESDVEFIDVCISPAASGSIFNRSVPGISNLAVVFLVLLSAFLYGGRNRIYKHKSKR